VIAALALVVSGLVTAILAHLARSGQFGEVSEQAEALKAGPGACSAAGM
jgi:hypothetical protein